MQREARFVERAWRACFLFTFEEIFRFDRARDASAFGAALAASIAVIGALSSPRGARVEMPFGIELLFGSSLISATVFEPVVAPPESTARSPTPQASPAARRSAHKTIVVFLRARRGLAEHDGWAAVASSIRALTGLIWIRGDKNRKASKPSPRSPAREQAIVCGILEHLVRALIETSDAAKCRFAHDLVASEVYSRFSKTDKRAADAVYL